MSRSNRNHDVSYRQPDAKGRHLNNLLTLAASWLLLGCCALPAGELQDLGTQLDPMDLLLLSPIPDAPETNTINTTTAAIQGSTPPTESLRADILAADTAAQPDTYDPQGRITIPTIDKELSKQIRQMSISAPIQPQTSTGTNELDRLIAQLRSLEIQPARPQVAPPAAIQSTIRNDLKESTVSAEPPQSPPQDQQEQEPAYRQLTDSTLQMIKDACADPNLLDNPFELAEVLFHSGHSQEAGLLYQQTLSRIDADSNNTATDRGWILFQMGNCLRKSDPAAAHKSYLQLIAEYPDSPWAAPAKAYADLLDWYQQENPQALIEASKSQMQ